jgi:O-succinylbenzoate synthase
MMEQPLYWDDIYAHAKLQAQIKSPICLDECIHNTRHALTAIELNACRIINIKVGRVGGHSEARLLQEACRTRGVPVWCGGMLESGIGRAHNVAMSTLPGFSLPGDVSASSRYWDEDIIDPEVQVSAKGTIEVPTASGIGYQVRRDRVEALTVRSKAFSAKSQASVLTL